MKASNLVVKDTAEKQRLASAYMFSRSTSDSSDPIALGCVADTMQ